MRIIDLSERKNRYQLGKWGEEIVAIWLLSRGWITLEHGWREAFGGEIDLLVKQGDCLAAIEVKTIGHGVRTEKWGLVSRQQLARIRKGFLAYLLDNYWANDFRIFVIWVCLDSESEIEIELSEIDW